MLTPWQVAELPVLYRTFSGFTDPHARLRIPDPQAAETFLRCRLRWDERQDGEHARVLELYRRRRVDSDGFEQSAPA